MKRILLGRWNCSQCGETKLSGKEKSCPNCGDPRNPVNDPSEEPYLLSDADDITGTELAAELGEQPDWICDHCGQANHYAASSCRGCGQAHDAPDENVQTRVWSGLRNHIPKPIKAATTTAVSQFKTKPTVRLSAVGGVVGVVLLGVVWGVWAMFFSTHTIEIEVADVSWSRGIEVEEYRTLQKEDFDPPSDARVHDSWRAVHHYDKVLDGYRTEHYTEQVPYTSTESYTDCQTVSNGNGTFTQQCSPRTRTVTNYRSESRTRQVPVYRDEPVYRTKYRYEIDRWVTDSYFTVDSTDADEPFWPENVPPAKEPQHRIGDERKEKYEVVFNHDEDTFTKTVDLDVWETLDVGEVLEANMNRKGDIRSINWELAA